MAFGPTGPRFRSLSGRWGAFGAKVAATLTTALTGNNNDLKYTHVASPANYIAGNSVRVRYVDPAGNDAALGVVVAGSDITVNLATGGAGAITSTAAQVKTAIEASTPASALVTVANATGNDGTGVVTALAYTALTGGQDYVIGTSR